MKMICPDCLGPLVSADGKTARCTLHGGQYQILFVEGDPAAAPPPLPQAIPATGSTEAAAYPVALPAPAPLSGAAGHACTFHPGNPATAFCKMCGLPVCVTCAFVFPNGLCCCPTCATKPPEISSKRKGLAIWAYILAAWCVAAFIVMVVLMAGNATSRQAEQALGVLISVLVFVPSLVGTGLAFSAIERRGANSMWMWGAVVVNCLVLAILILLTIIGNLR